MLPAAIEVTQVERLQAGGGWLLESRWDVNELPGSAIRTIARQQQRAAGSSALTIAAAASKCTGQAQTLPSR